MALSPKRPAPKSLRHSPHKSPKRAATSPAMPLELSLTVPRLPLPPPLPLPTPSPFPSSSHLTHILGGPITLYPCAFSIDLSLLFLPSLSLIRVVSLKTGQCVQLLCGHTADVTAVLTPSKNRLQLYSTSLDGTVRLWDLHSGACIRVWTVGIPILNAVLSSSSPWPTTPSRSSSSSSSSSAAGSAFLAHETLYLNVNRHAIAPSHASPAAQRSCRIFAFELATSTLTLLYKSRCCSHIVLSPSQQYLASIAKHTLCLYHLPSRRRSKFAHAHNLTSLAFHPRDAYLATGDVTGRIVLWYKLIPAAVTWAAPSTPSSAVSSLLSSALAAGRSDGGGVGGDSGGRPVVSTLHWHAHAVACLSFTRDGAYLLSGGEESVMVIWQLETGHKQFIPRLLAPLRSIVVSEDNLTYALLHSDNAVRIVSAVTSRVTRCIQGLEYAHSLRIKQAEAALPPVLVPAPGGVIVSGRSGFLQLFDPWSELHVGDVDVTERNVVSRMDEELVSQYRVEHVAVSSDLGWMLTVERRTDADMREKQAIKFWRHDTAAAATDSLSPFASSPYLLHSRVDAPHKQSVVDVGFHPSLPLAVTASADRTFKLWSLSQKPTLTATAAAAAAKSPHEMYWLCTSEGYYRDYPVHRAAFSADGLLAVSYGQLLTVWAVTGEQGEALELRRTLLHSTPSYPVLHVCWIGAGGRVATATSEMLYLWDARTGRCEWSWRVRVTSMCCDSNGLLAVCVASARDRDAEGNHRRPEASEAKNAAADEETEEKEDERDGDVDEDEMEQQRRARGLFDSVVSHLLLFRPTSSAPFRVWRLDDLRLHRYQQSTTVFTSSVCFLSPPAQSQRGSSSLLYLSKQKQLVRLDDVDSQQYEHEQPGGGADSAFSPSLLSADSERQLSLFEKMYGKAALPSLPSRPTARPSPPPPPPPAAAAAAAGNAGNAWAALFAGPSHLLPPMSTLIVPFMDAVLPRKDDGASTVHNAAKEEGAEEAKMQLEGDGEEGESRHRQGVRREGESSVEQRRVDEDEALFRAQSSSGLFQLDGAFTEVARLWQKGSGQRPRGDSQADGPGPTDDADASHEASVVVDEHAAAAATVPKRKGRKSAAGGEKLNGGLNGHSAAGAAAAAASHGKENGAQGGSSVKRRQTLPVQNGTEDSDKRRSKSRSQSGSTKNKRVKA